MAPDVPRLRHPNYRLWFAGQLCSLMGTWMRGAPFLPLALLAFAAARSVPIALTALVGVGVGLILFYNNANTILVTGAVRPRHPELRRIA